MGMEQGEVVAVMAAIASAASAAAAARGRTRGTWSADRNPDCFDRGDHRADLDLIVNGFGPVFTDTDRPRAGLGHRGAGFHVHGHFAGLVDQLPNLPRRIPRPRTTSP